MVKRIKKGQKAVQLTEIDRHRDKHGAKKSEGCKRKKEKTFNI